MLTSHKQRGECELTDLLFIRISHLACLVKQCQSFISKSKVADIIVGWNLRREFPGPFLVFIQTSKVDRQKAICGGEDNVAKYLRVQNTIY